jgi:hypothetical protein
MLAINALKHSIDQIYLKLIKTYIKKMLMYAATKDLTRKLPLGISIFIKVSHQVNT